MLYLLDTNAVSLSVRGNANINARLKGIDVNQIVISAIVEAELLRGLTNKPKAAKTHQLVHHFLSYFPILPFDSLAAQQFAEFQQFCSQSGKTLAAIDALIAAHAKSVGATVVTSDKAFFHVTDFVAVEDWANPYANELN